MKLLALAAIICIAGGLGAKGQSSEGKLSAHQQWLAVSPDFAAKIAKKRQASVPATWAKARATEDPRDAKSLRNTFPFNHDDHEDHDDHHHHEHRHEPSQSLDSRFARQGSNDDIALDIGSIAAAGERCIDKVVMVQETEFDNQILCKHSYSTRCHTTYATDYEPQQEEECEENFKKQCYIEFKKKAIEEQVQFCYTPLVRNCDIPGPTECTTEYRSECATRYHEHDVEDDVPECEETYEEKCEDVTQGYTTNRQCTKWPVKKCQLSRQNVKKYSPETECKKVPFELCGPSACPVEPGQEQCQNRRETLIQEVPEETCNLEPQRSCKQVTKLVPNLKPRENCIDVPKEVCSRSRVNPRRVSKPVIKKWCYTPTPESGLPPRPTNGFGNGNSNQGNGNRPNFTPRPPTSGRVSCAPGYPADYCPARAGDGRCQPECNTARCNFDGGDCRPPPPPRRTTTPPPGCLQGRSANYCPIRAGNGRCDPECNTFACGYDAGDCDVQTTPRPLLPNSCAPGYPASYCPARRNNGVCEPECNTARCGYDGDDCKPPAAPPNSYLPPRQGY